MQKLDTFSQFNQSLNEGLKSSILKQIDPRDLKQISYKIDLENITDADIHEIPDPTVLTKKPYTTNYGYNWMILVMGNYTERNPKTKERETRYGLRYTMFGADVNSAITNHEHSGRRSDPRPSRKQLIEDAEHYKFYAIEISDAKQEPLHNLRRDRSRRKSNVLINPNLKNYSDKTARQLFDDEIRKRNLDRYSQKIKEGSDFSYAYKLFQDKITEACKELCALIEETKYLQSKSATHELSYQTRKDIENLSFASSDLVKMTYNLTYDVKSDAKYTKVDLLNVLFHEFVDRLTSTPNKENFTKIKTIIKFVNIFKFEYKSLTDLKMEKDEEPNSKKFFED